MTRMTLTRATFLASFAVTALAAGCAQEGPSSSTYGSGGQSFIDGTGGFGPRGAGAASVQGASVNLDRVQAASSCCPARPS